MKAEDNKLSEEVHPFNSGLSFIRHDVAMVVYEVSGW